MLATGSFISRMVNQYWVRTCFVPLQPIAELQLDLSRPIIYVLEHNSASDLLGLRSSCIAAGLPDPYQAIEIDGQKINATIYLQEWSLFSAKNVDVAKAPYLSQYQQLVDLHQQNKQLDVQLVPVTFYWGRNPGRQGKTSWFDLLDQRDVGAIQKSLIVLKNAKDHLVRFNQPITIKKLVQRQTPDQQLAHKLARVASAYFSHQKRSSIGPKLPNRKEMIQAVLTQPEMQKVMAEFALQQGCSIEKIEAECRSYLQEIGANFSYSFLRVFRKLLSWGWNHIYQGVEVNHAQAVRQACQSGAEIVYMPCHRSHMDYLLLSYLLFEQGMMPPHVAAGVNLNFFPAGSVFRRSGAFFLRRTFKDSPLYAQVFKAYFAMLFKQGYPIEFFTEGGRSRTGKLLPAKTGLLAMSLQTYLAQTDRNLVIVPVYIGYDHIMEVKTYSKELTGQKKEKESFWQLLGIVRKLGNFGRAFVNFGEPINVKEHLQQYTADTALDETQFKQQVEHIAQRVMVGINQATAVNALPLCAAILLATKNYKVGKAQLFQLIRSHLQLLALQPSDSLVTYPKCSTEDIYQQALAMEKFIELDNQVFCEGQQATLLTYYRNNIIHLFALESLLVNTLDYCLKHNYAPTKDNLLKHALLVYPLLKAEFFLPELDAHQVLNKALSHLCEIDLLVEKDNLYAVHDEQLFNLFIGHLRETYQRYSQALQLLVKEGSWQQVDIKQLSVALKKQLKSSSIEPFDSNMLIVYCASLQSLYPNFISETETQQLLDIFNRE